MHPSHISTIPTYSSSPHICHPYIFVIPTYLSFRAQREISLSPLLRPICLFPLSGKISLSPRVKIPRICHSRESRHILYYPCESRNPVSPHASFPRRRGFIVAFVFAFPDSPAPRSIPRRGITTVAVGATHGKRRIIKPALKGPNKTPATEANPELFQLGRLGQATRNPTMNTPPSRATDKTILTVTSPVPSIMERVGRVPGRKQGYTVIVCQGEAEPAVAVIAVSTSVNSSAIYVPVSRSMSDARCTTGS